MCVKYYNFNFTFPTYNVNSHTYQGTYIFNNYTGKQKKGYKIMCSLFFKTE